MFNLINAYKKTSAEKKPLWSKVNVHTKIVLITTFSLIVSGFFLLIVTSNNKVDVSSALFQSITARTAGFNTIPIDGLPLSSLLVLIILMFIGGSPGSCAGGVKTTTFALWINQLWNRVRGRSRAVFFERFIAEPLVRRSSTIISLAVLLNILGVFILSITENNYSHHGLHAILFEQISAFGTVGLSTGITPDLSQTGRLWIILTMFIGRTGTLTTVLLLLKRKPLDVKYPEGKVMIG